MKPVFHCIRLGLIKRIHVDQHIIKRNKKEGRNDPPITIQTSKGPIKAYQVSIVGPSTVKYTPETPLSCGATIYVETTARVDFLAPKSNNPWPIS